MLEVVIDRTKWLRGEGSQKSALLRESDGKMCCMGFACLAAGIPREQILGLRTLGKVSCEMGGLPRSLKDLFLPYPVNPGIPENYDCSTLYETNDDAHIEDRPREKELTTTGRCVGLEFKFIN